MSMKTQWSRLAGALTIGAVLCLGTVSFATTQSHKKTKKSQTPPPPTIPSGPTGQPVQQVPLDSIAAVPPEVTFQNNQLTIVAPNSTLADILRAVKKQTGAEIEIPSAPDRVVTHLGPGPAREVMADLLNGSRFNYILLGSPADETALTRIVLVAKSGPQDIAPPPASPVNPAMAAPTPNAAQLQPDQQQDGAEAEATDDNQGDDNADQNSADADQQPADNPPVKTPQQMLQEMQQRQLQLQQQQQQQQSGQAPVPGSGMPPHPPQEQ